MIPLPTPIAVAPIALNTPQALPIYAVARLVDALAAADRRRRGE